MSVANVSGEITQNTSFRTFGLIQSLTTSIVQINTVAILVHINTHEKGKNRRSNITQSARIIAFLIFRKRVLLGIACHNEWNRVGGMCGMGVSSVVVDHLLSVAVVGSDEQDVSGFFASPVNRADSLVGSRDRLDRRI